MGGLLALLPGTSSDTTQYTLLPSMPSSIRKDLQDEEERRDDTDISDLNADLSSEERRRGSGSRKSCSGNWISE